mmetsp:Transcript_26419/g.62902  ORF Transcript_26419/g.62902 Transcript_26419/m.62902 type:complete len:546 (-) Transcript_26419:312-1949(-)
MGVIVPRSRTSTQNRFAASKRKQKQMPNAELESSTASATDEQYDQVAPLCTCGHGIISSSHLTSGVSSSSSSSSSSPSTGANTTKSDTSTTGGGKWLGSSFIHLVTHPRGLGVRTSSTKNNEYDGQHLAFDTELTHDFLEQNQHLLQLLNAARGVVKDDPHGGGGGGSARSGGGGGEDGVGVHLCADCADRVAAALEADTRRLYSEVETYQETVTAAELRAKTLQKQLSTTFMSSTSNSSSSSSSESNPTLTLAAAEDAYRQELSMLEQEIQAREEELEHLAALYEDHMFLSTRMDEEDEQTEHEQNSLELESESFDYRRQLLTGTLTEVQDEMDKLSIVPLPRALWSLQVDPRGLRYPLINQLRLAFQPKGDVQTQEIQVAWSQATQLLLFLGKLFEYPGQDWKVIPLAPVAKLIYRKEIFNLSPGNTRSLLAWNALLDQVVKYAWSISSSDSSNRQQRPSHPNKSTATGPSSSANYNNLASMPPPFPSTPTSIGDTELARLDRTDHVGWSQVIHRMASNLSWLSDRASERAAMQVASTANCAV